LQLYTGRIEIDVTASAYNRRSFLATGISAAAGLALGPLLAESRDLTGLTIKKASDLLRRKAVSAVELTQACLQRIETYDPLLNAFITVSREQALSAAREMDAELRRGNWRGPLHGIPIAVKDNIDTAGVRTTAASELFKDRIPSEDAEVIRKLKRAGAIVIGKTNLHEFAYGGSSSISYFGPVHNPWALDRVPGGSSGGSAVAVAADLCFAALGTDTAGSVRIPASYCGIVGFKPTYGRVSNRGVVPLSWTLDHVGPLCKTVEDAALLLGVIAGLDALDPSTVDVPAPDYRHALGTSASRLRLGVPRAPFFDGVEDEIAKAVDRAIDVLRRVTAEITDVELPAPGSVGASSVYRAISGPEAAAYHSQWLSESPGKYQPAIRERLVQFSAAVTQQEYVQARRRCDLLRREIRKVFTTVDLLVLPTMIGAPSPIAPIEQSGTLDAGRIRNTWPFDVYGIPAITIPCGFTSSGLPIGLQIAGAPFAEATVLVLAHAYERATEWHSRHPKLNRS
jgi:aspartyl-tRNA(Asn)/glutamyl-tRNA(Gln) amidotransferase subunit A